MTIDDATSTTDIGGGEWGDGWDDQEWYNDRGAAVSDLNGTFYSMTEDDQHFFLKFAITSDGVVDTVENLFDGDEDTSGDQRTVTYKFRIDGDGEIEILEETWE